MKGCSSFLHYNKWLPSKVLKYKHVEIKVEDYVDASYVGIMIITLCGHQGRNLHFCIYVTVNLITWEGKN